MRSVEAVADPEQASTHAGDDEDGNLYCYPLAGGSGGMARLRVWDRSAAIPSMPSRFRGGAPRQH